MKKRAEQIAADMENHKLSLDDTFRFKCRGCGKCCKNREDILLTARDLCNIAGDLHRTVPEIIDRYCEVYIGSVSRMPVVRLKPAGPDNACPLLRDKRCIVHKAKPVICALFPLGRAFCGPADEAGNSGAYDFKPQYFLQSGICGSKNREQTVREWLRQSGIPADDAFFVLWTRAVIAVSAFFRRTEEQGVPDSTIKILRGLAYHELYLVYDPFGDLIPRFKEKSEKLIANLESLKVCTKKTSGGQKNGTE